MAATIVTNKRTKMQAMYVAVADVTGDDSYPTGGYPITPAIFGLTTFDTVLVPSSSGYTANYNAATGKIVVYASANTQVANAVDLSAVTFRILAMGT